LLNNNKKKCYNIILPKFSGGNGDGIGAIVPAMHTTMHTSMIQVRSGVSFYLFTVVPAGATRSLGLRSGSAHLTCKFHSAAHSVLAIGMERSDTGPYRYTIPNFIIIIIYE
jgi:hypothetical protein